MLQNDELTNDERIILELFLSYDIPQKSIIVEQINSAKIDREYTKHYYVVKFVFLSPPLARLSPNSRFDTTLQIQYIDKKAPTVMILFAKDVIVEFEVYNADLTELEIGKIKSGVDYYLEC